MTPISDSLLAKAQETYRLELALGTDEPEALRKAIGSVLLAQAHQIMAEVADMAARMAEELDAGDDDDMATDGPAALLWLAQKLQDTLPKD